MPPPKNHVFKVQKSIKAMVKFENICPRSVVQGKSMAPNEVLLDQPTITMHTMVIHNSFRNRSNSSVVVK